jgi:hypothetical protein
MTSPTAASEGDEAITNSSSTSNYVYIHSDDYAWLPARVVAQQPDDEEVTVQVPVYKSERQMKSDGGRSATSFRKQQIKLADYPNQALPLQNVNEQGQLLMVEDMVDLPFLHEVRAYNNRADLRVGWEERSRTISEPHTPCSLLCSTVFPFSW